MVFVQAVGSTQQLAFVLLKDFQVFTASKMLQLSVEILASEVGVAMLARTQALVKDFYHFKEQRCEVYILEL